ncbi:MAG: DNA mismatch repair protein MutS [Clostridia bacterium]|nr:DNA mismatch repair protein MutS [Clostridia bacterium]
MMRQYFEIKDNYRDYILFYRLGDFYEMFFDDAIKASKALEITLTARNCGLDEKAPLCGVPYHAAEGYLAKLIEKGFKVAVCEQVEDPKTAKGIVKRDVIRIVTPGTVIEPGMLDEKNNNYILSLYNMEDRGYGLAYADITTGELKATTFDRSISTQKVTDELMKINPSEIILIENGLHNDIMLTIDNLPKVSLSYRGKDVFHETFAEAQVKDFFNIYAIDSIGLEKASPELCATGALIDYIKETQKVDLQHFDRLELYHHDHFMVLDKFTRKNLELTETIRGKDKKGSLLWILDKTCTSMGSRTMKRWIEQPLLNIEQISKRQDAVEALYGSSQKRDELRSYLKEIYDLERLSSKLVFGNVNCRDLIALRKSLGVLPYIKSLLETMPTGLFADILSSYDTLETTYNLIDTAIVEEPPFSVREGGMFKASYNEDLAELRYAVTNGKDWILDIEQREKERTGIKTLKIGFNKVFGYYLDVTRANSELVPDDYIRKQTLANSERYITQELKEIEEKVLGAEDKIKALEYDLFVDLKNRILKDINILLHMGRQIAIIDVITSFAEVSYRQSYVRPVITDEDGVVITEGRHPVVEHLVNAELFIPNDTLLDKTDNKLYIITGPNMAGKSTYLRQVALITLMGQIGCYVPAAHAEIGIVDRIFTRVGASDDLSQGQSTFMVEMNELANILHNATPRSLIILDEIGRGTSTYDGLSIAWAVVEYLSKDSGIAAKTMFATHYHELTEIEGKIDGVRNYSISAKEQGDDIVFLRKIVKGRANQSFGIQVAKLAGVPAQVIDRAKDILSKLEEHDINNNVRNISDQAGQIDFFTPPVVFEDETTLMAKTILQELKQIDLMQMTPMDAMNILYQLKGKLGE